MFKSNLFFKETIITTLATLATLAMAGCGNDSKVRLPPVPQAVDIKPSELTGTWEKKGYGEIIHFNNNTFETYQVNRNNCGVLNEQSTVELDTVLGHVT
jgi:hypothetical protein